MAAQSLKIDHILYLLTLDPQRRIIRDGAVLVQAQQHCSYQRTFT